MIGQANLPRVIESGQEELSGLVILGLPGAVCLDESTVPDVFARCTAQNMLEGASSVRYNHLQIALEENEGQYAMFPYGLCDLR